MYLEGIWQFKLTSSTQFGHSNKHVSTLRLKDLWGLETIGDRKGLEVNKLTFDLMYLSFFSPPLPNPSNPPNFLSVRQKPKFNSNLQSRILLSSPCLYHNASRQATSTQPTTPFSQPSRTPALSAVPSTSAMPHSRLPIRTAAQATTPAS